MPLGLVGLFFAFGLTIPAYEFEALRKRSVCEEIAGPFRRDECQRIYDSDISGGRALARSSTVTPGYIAPADRRLAEEAERARRADDEATLQACRRTSAAKRAEYERQMRAQEYWEASLVLRRCSDLQPDDAELKKLVATAEQRQYVSEIESKSSTQDIRNQAIDALLRDYPDVGQRYARLRK